MFKKLPSKTSLFNVATSWTLKKADEIAASGWITSASWFGPISASKRADKCARSKKPRRYSGQPCGIRWCAKCGRQPRAALIREVGAFIAPAPLTHQWAVTILFPATSEPEMQAAYDELIDFLSSRGVTAVMFAEIATKREQAKPHMQEWMGISGQKKYVPHVHGVMVSPSDPGPLLREMYGEKGQVLIKAIYDLSSWLSYCTKRDLVLKERDDAAIINAHENGLPFTVLATGYDVLALRSVVKQAPLPLVIQIGERVRQATTRENRRKPSVLRHRSHYSLLRSIVEGIGHRLGAQELIELLSRQPGTAAVVIGDTG